MTPKQGRVQRSRRSTTVSQKSGGSFFKAAGNGFFPRAFEAAMQGSTSIGNIHLHTDARAAQLAENVKAKAFTYGGDIFFNQGAYNPGSADGRHLLAHELAHAVQPATQHKIMRKPKDDDAEVDWGRRGTKAQKLFWDDLHANFPNEGHKLAGSGFDKKQSAPLYTTMESVELKVKGGTISTSALCVVVGKAYFKEKDAKIRAGYIKAELAKIDGYRFDHYMLDNADLAATEAKLKGMSLEKRLQYEQALLTYAVKSNVPNDAIVGYLKKLRFDQYEIADADLADAKVSAALDALSPENLLTFRQQAATHGKASKRPVSALDGYIVALLKKASLDVISTPMEDAGQLQTTALGQIGKMVINVGSNVVIEVLPDGVSSSIKSKGGETSITNNLPKSYYYSESNGVVTDLYENSKKETTISLPSKIVFTVQTLYQPGVNKLDPSAYGRGTTDKDKADQNTTLQFHEGAHGTDFITAIRGYSFPANLQTGTITAAEINAMYKFVNGLGKMTEEHVDEVGYKKSEHDKAEKKKKK